MDIFKIISKVKDYSSFLTLEELNQRAFDIAKKYNFNIEEIGKSLEGRPIYMIKVGSGSKTAFLWGFPHPNEPIGSLTIDFMLEYLGENPTFINETDYTWYFIYTADPDGTVLNEGWFKGKLDIDLYFKHFYRPPADRMIDWTFPITYKNFEWNAPMPETKILMNIIEKIKPDLMYPLHNYGFGGAYFFSTKKFSKRYYNNILDEVKKLGIPLHLGEPEEEFMRPIIKPFYYDFGFIDYYEHQVKMGNDPIKVLKHGDNSTHYLLKIKPDSVTIKGEIPYFYDKKIFDISNSKKTRRQIWLDYLNESSSNKEIYQKVIPLILNKIQEQDPYYYLTKLFERNIAKGNESFRKHIESSKEYDRIATNAEVFDCEVCGKFWIGLSLGQLRRAALKANLSPEIISQIEDKMKFYSAYVESNSEWKTLPIKKLVQLQALVLLETLREMKESNL